MTTSESISAIAAALVKAQAVMVTAAKDSTNPHFRSRYADLASVRDAARPLAEHGIAIVQGCAADAHDGHVWAVVETRLIHTSGEWIADALRIPVSRPDAQGVASAMTYARRIALAGLIGVAPADDDGEAAVGRPDDPAVAVVPSGYDEWVTDMEAVAGEGIEPLKRAWRESKAHYRHYLTTHDEPRRGHWKRLAEAADARREDA